MSQNSPYYSGGGGYLQGGSFSASQSPGGLRKAEIAHSLRPVIIGQLARASQAHTDAEWTIDGVEIGQITVVASVVSIQRQTTNCVYTIDDGTGRIEARQWIDSNEGDSDRHDNIKEHTYVRVTGSLKTFGQKRYINATHIRLCQDPHEIMFHIQEVIYAILVMERGQPPRPGQEQQSYAGGSISTLAESSAYVTQSHPSHDEYASLPPIPRKIITFIINQPPSKEGVNIGAIARHVGGAAEDINDALDILMDRGLIFNITRSILIVDGHGVQTLPDLLQKTESLWKSPRKEVQDLIDKIHMYNKFEGGIRHINLRQLTHATQAHSSAPFELDGHELHLVMVVANVLDTRIHTRHHEYKLVDGTTGQSISAKLWAQDIQGLIFEDLEYVRVVGTLEQFRQRNYLKIYDIRPVDDVHEVLYHVLQCITNSLIDERGPPSMGDIPGMQVDQILQYPHDSYASEPFHTTYTETGEDVVMDEDLTDQPIDFDDADMASSCKGKGKSRTVEYEDHSEFLEASIDAVDPAVGKDKRRNGVIDDEYDLESHKTPVRATGEVRRIKLPPPRSQTKLKPDPYADLTSLERNIILCIMREKASQPSSTIYPNDKSSPWAGVCVDYIIRQLALKIPRLDGTTFENALNHLLEKQYICQTVDLYHFDLTHA